MIISAQSVYMRDLWLVSRIITIIFFDLINDDCLVFMGTAFLEAEEIFRRYSFLKNPAVMAG